MNEIKREIDSTIEKLDNLKKKDGPRGESFRSEIEYQKRRYNTYNDFYIALYGGTAVNYVRDLDG